tara:strand:+ start:8926 stop:9756 length:831 start_codon:yes stop_codon:yes gene_type:complete
MKVFLAGHRGSKKILKASSYLVKKYLPVQFEINYLNYGTYNYKNLHGCQYINLGNFRKGGVDSWSSYLYKTFQNIDDEFIIFSLDDYFLSKNLNIENFNTLHKALKNNTNFVSAELSISPEEKYNKKFSSSDIYVYQNNYSFTVNTQWRIWKREFLLEILKNTSNPWSFEIEGSKYLNNSNCFSISHCSDVLNYPEISSLSNRNKNKISVLGNQEEDISDLIKLGYLKLNQLVLGQWKIGTPKYTDFKNNQFKILDLIKDKDEKRFYKLMLDKCLI